MKSFLCFIDNVISLAQVDHSVIWIIKCVILVLLLTTTQWLAFQKPLKTKLGNKIKIRVLEKGIWLQSNNTDNDI